MRVDLDAEVRTRDGAAAGRVQQAVFDPQRNEVTHFVVATGGRLGRDVLVPRDELERATADGDALRLRLSRDDLDRLPAFAPDEYVPPPTAWVPPYGYGYPAPGYLWPVRYPYVYPDQEPRVSDPDAPLTLDKGAAVVDRNGEDVGAVDDVRFDPDSGRLRGFVLRVGGTLRTLFGGGDAVEVGAAQVERIEGLTVRLRLSKDDLHRLIRAG